MANRYVSITTNTTTVCALGWSILHSVTVNKPGASTVVTLYDASTAAGAVSANLIGTITCPASAGNPFTVIYDINTQNGLVVVTSGGASDVTVSVQ